MSNLVNLTDVTSAKELYLDPQATMRAARFTLNELNQQRDAKHKMLQDVMPDSDAPQYMAAAFRADDVGVLADLLDKSTTAIVTGESRLIVKIAEYKVIETMYSNIPVRV